MQKSQLACYSIFMTPVGVHHSHPLPMYLPLYLRTLWRYTNAVIIIIIIT